MENMSNAQKIKSYYKVVLADGAEHSRIELFEYAKKSSGCNYTEGMLTGSLRTLVKDSQEYSCVRRGWYKKKSVEEQKQESNSVVWAYAKILKETLKKSSDITLDTVSIMNMSNDDFEKMRKIKNCLGMIKQTVEDIQ